LKLQLLEGKFLKDIQTFGKMDPFVVLKLRNDDWKSQIRDGAGKYPKWDNSISEWDVKYAGDDFTIEARDDEVFGSRMIGMTVVKISTFIWEGGFFDEWTPVYAKGKEIGRLHWHAWYTDLTKPKEEEKKEPVVPVKRPIVDELIKKRREEEAKKRAEEKAKEDTPVEPSPDTPVPDVTPEELPIPEEEVPHYSSESSSSSSSSDSD
jgi:hypothetical protein